SRPCRHHGIGARPRLERPGLRHLGHVGAVDLIGRRERLCRQTDQGKRPAAVFRDVGRLVARAVAAVERGVDAGADAGLTREEAVADARAVSQGLSLNHGVGGCSNPGGVESDGAAIASALNKVPICSRWSKRSVAVRMSAACAGVAFRASAAARSLMPRRSSSVFWAIGPYTAAPASRAARARAPKST